MDLSTLVKMSNTYGSNPAYVLAGGGNTDFRPAFEYVNNLLDTGEIKKLQGLSGRNFFRHCFPDKQSGTSIENNKRRHHGQ